MGARNARARTAAGAMARGRALWCTLAVTALAAGTHVAAQGVAGPDTVVVASGNLRLRGLLWRPVGAGRFPAILFNHGSGRTVDELTVGRGPETIGPTFARHGYVLLFLFRRGAGLSEDQGNRPGDALERELAQRGQEVRNRVQIQMLETEQLPDALAGLAFLRARSDVDAARVGVVGHSLGGSLTLLLAARDSSLRAAVDFSGAAFSWSRSPELRTRLLAAVRATTVPILFIHPANDYGVEPGPVLSAEMTRLGKRSRLTMYPAYGTTTREGHNFLFLAPQVWERDVFAFLDEFVGS